MTMNIAGYNILIQDRPIDQRQFRFPRTKRRRTNKTAKKTLTMQRGVVFSSCCQMASRK